MNTQPLSHLTLERYALGELPEAEAALVAAQLEFSSDDRVIYEAILADTAELPPLPQLDFPSPAASNTSLETATTEAPDNVWPLRRVLPMAATIAVAAAALIALVPRLGPGLEPPLSSPRPGHAIKGGDVSLSLVGERSGPSPERRKPGERLKLRVTCPPGTLGAARVTVFQGDETFQPLPEVDDFPCGNLVPWPGAFRLTSDAPATVCVHWADDLDATPRSTPGHHTTCMPLPPQAD